MVSTTRKKNNITYSLSIKNNTDYNYSGLITLVFDKNTICNEKNDNYNEEATILYNHVVSKIMRSPEYKIVNGDYSLSLKNFSGSDDTYNKVIDNFVKNSRISE